MHISMEQHGVVERLRRYLEKHAVNIDHLAPTYEQIRERAIAERDAIEKALPPHVAKRAIAANVAATNNFAVALDGLASIVRASAETPSRVDALSARLSRA